MKKESKYYIVICTDDIAFKDWKISNERRLEEEGAKACGAYTLADLVILHKKHRDALVVWAKDAWQIPYDEFTCMMDYYEQEVLS